MANDNESPECRLKNTETIKNYFIKEIHQHELMSKKHKKFFTTLNNIEQVLMLASAVTGCISISAFASLFGFPIEATISAI